MAMTGTLAEVSLSDLIQVVCIEKDAARLTLENETGSAIIYFDDGEIVHAQSGSRSGPEALYEVLGWKNGEFRLEKGLRTSNRTVHGRWTAHMLEGMVRLDTGRLKQQVEGAAAGAPDPVPSQPAPAPAPAPAAPVDSGADEDREFLRRMQEIQGVTEVVVVNSDGTASTAAPPEQTEEEGALTAYLGNAAEEIGKAMVLGSLKGVTAAVSDTRHLVFDCGDCYVGLRLAEGGNAAKAGAVARKILDEKKQSK